MYKGGLSPTTFVLNFERVGSRPTNGTYQVGERNGENTGRFDGDFVDANDRSFYFTGGTVTITSSSPSRLSGTLSITASEDPWVEGSATITLTGTFEAKCTDGPDNDC